MAPYLLFGANTSASGKLAKGRHTGKFIPDGSVKKEGFCIGFFCCVDRVPQQLMKDHLKV